MSESEKTPPGRGYECRQWGRPGSERIVDDEDVSDYTAADEYVLSQGILPVGGVLFVEVRPAGSMGPWTLWRLEGVDFFLPGAMITVEVSYEEARAEMRKAGVELGQDEAARPGGAAGRKGRGSG